MTHLAEIIRKQKGEETVLSLRRHWVTFFPTVGLFLVLGFFPVAAYILIINEFAFMQDVFWYPVAVLSASMYYLFLLVFFFGQFIDYHLDMWIVTSERIVDVNQKALFSRIVTELHLDFIQDVTSESHGFFAHVFNYGEVNVHSSGPLQRIEFRNVPAPHNVRNILIQLIADDKRRHVAFNSTSSQAQFP